MSQGNEDVLQALAIQAALIAALSTRFDGQFSQIQFKFDELSLKMEAQTEASVKMEARLETMDKRFDNFAEKGAVQSLEQHLNDLERKIDVLEEQKLSKLMRRCL